MNTPSTVPAPRWESHLPPVIWRAHLEAQVTCGSLVWTPHLQAAGPESTGELPAPHIRGQKLKAPCWPALRPRLPAWKPQEPGEKEKAATTFTNPKPPIYKENPSLSQVISPSGKPSGFFQVLTGSTFYSSISFCR